MSCMVDGLKDVLKYENKNHTIGQGKIWTQEFSVRKKRFLKKTRQVEGPKMDLKCWKVNKFGIGLALKMKP